MSIPDRVLELMPYSRPFLFVDGFDRVDEEGAEGHYTFREDEYFYEGHFPGRPVTPGVILIETMAQIGLVGVGIYFELQKRLASANLGMDSLGSFKLEAGDEPGFVFAESEVAFLRPVFPGNRVFVRSKVIYFRLGKLKCRVEMFVEDAIGSTVRVCRGRMSGIVLPDSRNP